MAAVGACVVLGAMGLLTWQALRLEQREQAAQAQAEFQESLRKALWRIDSAMTPIIAREAARPYFEYQAFYPTKPPEESPQTGGATAETTAGTIRPEAKDNTDEPPGPRGEQPAREVLVPSPLLASTDEFVNLHFQVDAGGSFSSPQVPQGKMRDLAEAGYVTPYAIARTEDRLTELRKLTNFAVPIGASSLVLSQPQPEDAVPALVEAKEKQEGTPLAAGAPPTPKPGDAQTGKPAPPTTPQRQVPADGDNEYAARRDALNKATSQYNQQAEDVARGQQRGGGSRERAYRGVKEDDTKRNSAPPTDNKSDPGGSVAPPPAANTESEQQTKSQPQTSADENTARPGDTPTLKSGAKSPNAGAQQPPTPAGDLGDAEESAWPAGELIVQGQFTPRWLAPRTKGGEPELIFVRSVRVGDRALEQGFWLDWTRLRDALLEPVKPLFPTCTIKPVEFVSPTAPTLGRMLATIPAELVVDEPAMSARARWTPLRGVLVVVWVLVIGSVVAMFGIVRASIELAERRGRFVSAVTHELRTPLTTFCLYSQMLSDGMVPTEDAKRQYARTLHHESIRLTRIVESVLDFARLGRGSRAAFETMTLRELRARIEPGLLAACGRAEMRLDVTLTCDADQPVRTDPAILERVLGNLVDNACKYARNDADPDQNRIVLTWSIENGRMRASVRDFGPGVPFEEQARVFDAFVRGRAHAHGSTPGLGLGLALSKGLAEQLGGELRITEQSPGVEFVLDISAK